jgi:RNA recognition motif-containing protein
VSNLSFKLKEETELKSLFEEKFGEIKRIHLIVDPLSHAPHKGFAFIEFLDESSLTKAVKEKEIMIKDRLAIIKKSTRQITTTSQT